MTLLRPKLFLLAVVVVAPLAAQDRPLPLEDVIKEKGGHFRLMSAWISGGAYDLRSRSGSAVSSPAIRAYSGSAGLGVNWTYLGSRTNAWANYSGDYSLASRDALRSLSQLGEAGVMRRVKPRFTIGVVARAQSLNFGARVFQQPAASRQLQSSGFGGGLPTVGLGGSVDPVAEATATVPNTDLFALALGANQRTYSAGLVSGITLTPRTDIRLGISASQSEFPPTTGTNIQLPYTKMQGGYAQGSIRHLATPRTSLSWSFQGGQSRAQGQKFNFASNSIGVSRVLAADWYVYVSAGGGASSAFRAGINVPWLLQYTGMGGFGYAGQSQGLMIAGSHDAGDRLGLGFLSTSQLNIFWNLRPPTSAWALSARVGGALLRAEGIRPTKAGSAQLGLSRRLFGHIYALAEGTYVTNVQFAPQRLLATGGNSGLLDTSAQRAVRLSIVYRPAPDRK